MTTTTAHRLVPALCVYLGGFVIGLTLVSFPASSVVLRQLHHFSSEQYGAIYLPQLAASVIGALAGGALARRLSLRTMFAVALLAFALAAALLALSAQVSSGLALTLIMAGTASFGFGFGFGGGPLNAFAALLFPRHQGAALTALHMCAGSGLTVAPVLFAALAGHGLWWVGPSTLAATSGALFLLTTTATFPAPAYDDAAAADADHPGRTALFWLCAVIAILYSVAEGTFSNWATVFLTEERGLSATDAALALTCFWAALTGGRLIATLLATRLAPATFLIVLPCAMAAAMLWLPGIADTAQAYRGFAVAGLACSAFFPMLVAFTAARAPQAISWIASMLTAAMMVGVGLGSYAVGALRRGASIASLYGHGTIVPVACLLCVMLAVVVSRRSRA